MMNSIEKLIFNRCPEGVPYKSLGEIAKVNTGTQLNRSLLSSAGKYPVMNGGIAPSGYHDEFNTEGPVTVISQGGASAGFVTWMKGKLWLGAHCFAVTTYGEKTDSRFLYHFLKHSEFEIQNMKSGAGIPGLNRGKLIGLRCPAPPLEVQQEIVRILDICTNLEASLEAEIKARKTQYEFYRDRLLSFKDDKKGHVPFYSLGDIGTTISGLRGKSKEDFSDGNAPYVSYVEIFNNPGIDFVPDKRVKVGSSESQSAIRLGDVLITGSSETRNECGMSAVVTTQPVSPIYVNSFCFIWRPNRHVELDPLFATHLFRARAFRDRVIETANGVTRQNISKSKFLAIEIPIPPLEVQISVASILNGFTELEANLEAELQTRRKQFVHYRSKLLTFKELSVA